MWDKTKKIVAAKGSMESNTGNRPPDIKDRTFCFAVQVVNLCRAIESYSDVYRILGRLLLRSTTSIGSNTEEAYSGQNRADFIHKYGVALREARETIYWLRLIQQTLPPGQVEIAGLLQEAREISRIIGTIIVGAKSKN